MFVFFFLWVTAMLKLVKNLDKNLAMESMAGMALKLAFFKELVGHVKECREKLRELKGEFKATVFHEVDFVSKVSKSVAEHTGMLIKDIFVGEPAIYVPLTGDHIFMKEIKNRYAGDWEQSFNDRKHVIDLMTSLKKKSLSAGVNVKAGVVTGAYRELPLDMMMDPKMFVEKRYDDEEIAAIMAHEFGHAYTFFLYADRTILNNQFLSAMTKTYESGMTEQDRVYVFEHFCNENKVTPEQQAMMKKCKNEEELTVVYMSSEVTNCISELGYSLYDVTSCEALADQYACRLGAASYLAAALDKLFVDYHQTDRGLWYLRLMSVVMVFVRAAINNLRNILVGAVMGMFQALVASIHASVLFIISVGLIVYSMAFSVDKRDEIYDNPHARLNRIKLNSIDRLKDQSISKEERALFLRDVETVEAVIDKYSDGLKMGEIVAYVFRPAYRKAHNFEMLQKDLEAMASNQLFVDAAKMKMI